MRRFLVLLILFYSSTLLLSSSVSAANPTDFPRPIPCTDVLPNLSNPDTLEFHPLRPYPGSPCDKQIPQEITFSCGNNQAFAKDIDIAPGQGQIVARTADRIDYKVKKDVQFDIAIDLASAKVPFLGNTEDENLTDADKANNYLSWYLNGTVQQSEQKPLAISSGSSSSSTPTTAEPLKILALGDSITSGSVTDPATGNLLFTATSYLCPLKGRLPSAVFSGPLATESAAGCAGVPHAGYHGETTAQVPSRKTDWLPYVPTGPNAYVLIHLGTNDIQQNVPPADSLAAFQQIIAQVRQVNPDIHIVIAQIIPRTGVDSSPLNSQIAALASQSTAASPVSIINAGQSFNPADHTTDTVHPTNMGAIIIASNFAPALSGGAVPSSLSSDLDRLVNYSGPLKKLLPFDAQQDLRRTLITSNELQKEYHNYMVGCQTDALSPEYLEKAVDTLVNHILTNISQTGIVIGNTLELTQLLTQYLTNAEVRTALNTADWPTLRRLLGAIADRLFALYQAHQTLYFDLLVTLDNLSLNHAQDCHTTTFVGRLLGSIKRLKDFRTGHLPPDPTTYTSYKKYWDDYLNWLDRVNIPLIGGVLNFIFGSPSLRAGVWAELFQNVPFSSLEDTVGETLVTLPASPSHPDQSSLKLSIKPSSDSKINLPHLRNLNALSQIIAGVMRPQDIASLDPTDEDLVSQKITRHQPVSLGSGAPHPTTCTLSNIRVSDGDSLLGGKITADLTYKQEFTYSLPTGSPGGAVCRNDSDCQSRRCETRTVPNPHGPPSISKVCAGLPDITKTTTADSWVFTKVPLIGNIYATLVNSKSSLLRRFVPVGLLGEIPTDEKDILPAKSPNSPLVFPLLGSLSDHILGVGQANLNLQKLLRPFGLNSNSAAYSPISGTTDATCKACTSYAFPSEELRDVFESAASYYKVPASVLVGVFANESGFKFGWDSATTRAASCPGCSVTGCNDPQNISPSGAKGPWQFLSGTWGAYKNAVVEAGVPSHTTPNICNIVDATYAAAKKLHQESGGANQYATPSCWGTPYITAQGPSTSCSWDEKRIVTAVRQYLGYCEGQDSPLSGTCYSSTPGSCPARSSCQADPSQCYQTSVLNVALCKTNP